jgi:hypothetical protein
LKQLQAQTQARFASTRCCRVCGFVVVFANRGMIITGSLMIILGAEMRSRSG